MSSDLIIADPVREFPSIFPGNDTPQVRQRVETFYLSIASLFERWLKRSGNTNTQRSYREAVEGFIAFMGIRWPDEDYRFVRDVSVADVQAWRDAMQANGAAPSTLNHRISALSRFYTFMKEQAAELRLPILLPNPANTDFFARTTAKPRKQAQALTLNLLHQLFALPEGDSVLAWRDRALLRYMYAAGARRETACLAQVSDLDFNDEDGPTLFMRLKGAKHETIGLHIKAYETIQTYLDIAGLESGPLFRTRLNAKSQKLGPNGFEVSTMSRLLYSYLDRLPGAVKYEETDGHKKRIRKYSTHTLRKTAATFALKEGADIRKVQTFLAHEQVNTTQGYDMREFSKREGISHVLPM